MQSDLENIYGTSEPAEALSPRECGSMTFLVVEALTGSIGWGGVEVLRGIDYPIRDKDWGTLPTRTVRSERTSSGKFFRWERDFTTEDISIAGRCEVVASLSGEMTLWLRMEIKRDLELCRTGFVLLHPIRGLAGKPMTVRRSTREALEERFPDLISASQPAIGFVELRYVIDGVSVIVDTSGQPFEMEDQRNWSDASYKSYAQTFGFPHAYKVNAGEVVEHRLILTVSGGGVRPQSGAETPTLVFQREPVPETFPELAIATDLAWGPAALPAPLASLRRVARIDLRRGYDLGFLNTSGPRKPPIDLELVIPDDPQELTQAIDELSSQLMQLSVRPDHVFALPAAYLKSFQPDGPWPASARPSDAIAAARRAFPSARIGGGSLTNFTELNRRRPDPTEIDYLTHGSTAIVHASDDASVFQTLETLPDIFRSATQLAPGKAYRLGLISIGMRGNPYGAGLSPNPERLRRTMCAEDPRAQSLFGAAWLVGVATAAERGGTELLTLAGAGGPFAVTSATSSLTPAFHVLACLTEMQGGRRLWIVTGDRRLHAVGIEYGDGARVILANGSKATSTIICPSGGRAAILDGSAVKAASLDPEWRKRALRRLHGQIELPPYAVAFLDLETRDGGPR